MYPCQSLGTACPSDSWHSFTWLITNPVSGTYPSSRFLKETIRATWQQLTLNFPTSVWPTGAGADSFRLTLGFLAPSSGYLGWEPHWIWKRQNTSWVVAISLCHVSSDRFSLSSELLLLSLDYIGLVCRTPPNFLVKTMVSDLDLPINQPFESPLHRPTRPRGRIHLQLFHLRQVSQCYSSNLPMTMNRDW